MKFRLIAASGLCGRLLAIISGYRLAKMSGREYEVVWNVTGNEVPCNFTDLFEEPDFSIGPGLYNKKRSCPFNINLDGDIDIWATTLFDNEWKYPSDEVIKPFCDILKPKKHILDEVDDFTKTGFGLGIHLRRKEIHLRDNCNVPVIGYINKFLGENPESKFFLSTDCETTLGIFQQIYWGNIKTFSGNTYTRNSLRDMEVALINILILSRCNLIIRSGYSGYSHFASLLSKCPNIIL